MLRWKKLLELEGVKAFPVNDMNGVTKFPSLFVLCAAFYCFLPLSAGAVVVFEFAGEWPLVGESRILTDWPFNMAISERGDVYLANPFSEMIYRYDEKGDILGSWSAEYPVRADEYGYGPGDIAVSPLGYIYAVFTFGQAVKYYKGTGTLMGEWYTLQAPTAEFTGSRAIAVAPNGNVYVAFYNEHIIKYFSPTGSYLGEWSLAGLAPGGIEIPNDIEFSADGNLYVIVSNEELNPEKQRYRVGVFTGVGTVLGTWGGDGTGEGEFDCASGIAVDKNGIIYVTDLGNQRVQYFSSTGSFLGAWGVEGSSPGEFLFPVGVAVAPNGNVYVLDFGNNRIQYFRPVYNKE